MASPDPSFAAACFTSLDQTGGLRIVDEHHVGVEVETLEVMACGEIEDLLIGRGERVRFAVQGVVQILGQDEKILGPLNHVPSHVEAYLVQQRQQAVENFGNSAADQGGIDVEHALARQMLY